MNVLLGDTIPVPVLSFQLILLIVKCTASIRVDTQPNGPLVFNKWPPIQQHNNPPPLRHQLMYHLRSHRRIPPDAMRKRFHAMQPPPPPPHSLSQQRIMRPVKMHGMPHYVNKYSMYKPTMSTPPRINFHSSPPGPNSGEYVYENPFASVGMQPVGILEIFSCIETDFNVHFVFCL